MKDVSDFLTQHVRTTAMLVLLVTRIWKLPSRTGSNTMSFSLSFTVTLW